MFSKEGFYNIRYYGGLAMKNKIKKTNNENPKKFEKLLEDAIYEARKEIKAEYDEQLKKIEKEYKDILKINKSQNMEIIQK